MSRGEISRRVLTYLRTVGSEGVSCFEVGSAAWPDREIRGGRGVSSNGGGDYAAQMLLGRLKKEGLVEQAPSFGSTKWRLSTKGRVMLGKDLRVPKSKATLTEALGCPRCGAHLLLDPDPPPLIADPATPLLCCAKPRCGWYLLSRVAWLKLSPSEQGFILYMQASWPTSELHGLTNPHAHGTPAWEEFQQGEQRAVLLTQDSEE